MTSKHTHAQTPLTPPCADFSRVVNAICHALIGKYIYNFVLLPRSKLKSPLSDTSLM